MSDYSVSLPSAASESQVSLTDTLKSIKDEELELVDWAPSSPNWEGGRSHYDFSALPTSAFPAHHTGYELSVVDQHSYEASFDSDDGFYGYGASLPTPDIKPLSRAPTVKLQRISEEDEQSSEDNQSLPYLNLTYQPSPELSGTSAVLSRWLTKAIREERGGEEGGNERPHEEGSSRGSDRRSEGWAKPSDSNDPQNIFIDRDPWPLSGSELEGRSSVNSASKSSAESRAQLAETNSALIESSGPHSSPPAPSIATTSLISDQRGSYDPYREKNYKPFREQYQKWRPERSDASNKQYKPFVRLVVGSIHSKSTTSMPMQTQAWTSSSVASPVPTLPPFSDILDIPDETSGSTRFDARPSRATQTTASYRRGSIIDRPTRARSRYTQMFHNFFRLKGLRSDSSTSGAASNAVSASANERGITRFWAKTSRWATGRARSAMSYHASHHVFSRIGIS